MLFTVCFPDYLATFYFLQIGAPPPLPLSPHTKVAFALPHHVTEEKKKMARRNGECESARGESKNICNGEVEEQVVEEGEKGEEKENLSSSDSSTFSDREEDNPPFIR